MGLKVALAAGAAVCLLVSSTAHAQGAAAGDVRTTEVSAGSLSVPHLALQASDWFLSDRGAVALPAGPDLFAGSLVPPGRSIPWLYRAGVADRTAEAPLPDEDGLAMWMSPITYAVAAAAMVGLIREAGLPSEEELDHDPTLLEQAIAILLPRPVPIESLGSLIRPDRL